MICATDTIVAAGDLFFLGSKTPAWLANGAARVRNHPEKCIAPFACYYQHDVRFVPSRADGIVLLRLTDHDISINLSTVDHLDPNLP